MALHIVSTLIWAYFIMLMIRIVGSWIPELMGSRFMLFISFYTDPYLNLFRRFIPPLGLYRNACEGAHHNAFPMKCKPIQLGSLRLANNIFYAPLAGCSDFPFR